MSKDIFDAYGGFNDLASFRSELGNDVAGISDDDARKIIDESLRERAKLPVNKRIEFAETKEDLTQDHIADNLRAQKEAAERQKASVESEKQRLARELADARAAKNAVDSELSLTRAAKSRLSDELEFEKTRRLLGDRFILRGNSSLDDYLAKERIKREVKDELLDEKRRHQREKELWGTSRRSGVSSKSKVSTSKSKSRTRTKQVSRSKSPTHSTRSTSKSKNKKK